MACSVVNRLLYRYEREYVCGQRSALKRVLEGDSSSQQLMVLCVASVRCQDKAVQAEVTDGWYGVQAVLDPVLAQAHSKGRLRIGDKIACAGLRLSGVTEGVPPLTEKAGHARLMLNGNSVRRAPWDTKLGFQQRKAMFLSLSAISELGGPVGAALDVVVMRSYPTLYMETLSDGRRVMRSEKEELRISGALVEKRAALTQDLKERQLMARTKSASSARPTTSNIEACHGGKELYDYVMYSSADSTEARQQLTSTQVEALDRYVAEQQAEIEVDVTEAVDKQAPQRQVRALFKLLVCDYPSHKCKQVEASGSQLALITVWGPRGIGPADFTEGSRFLFTGLTVSPRKAGWQQMRSHHHQDAYLRLNFSLPGSHYRPMPVDQEIVQRSEYCERGALCIDELCHITPGQEVDLAGSVSGCQAGQYPSQSSILHLSTTDESGVSHIALIEFPVITYGAVSVASGCLATVRNCVYAPRAGAAPNTFYLKAGDGCELLY
ncbi:Breast cancer 2, early onset [Coemansia sp. RSA 2050]|nr:Breast cancer 2, early onset [Coemansia sp. RSA 2050]